MDTPDIDKYEFEDNEYKLLDTPDIDKYEFEDNEFKLLKVVADVKFK